MFTALLLLIVVIVSVPVFIVADGGLIQGLVAAFAAVALLVVAAVMRPGEARHLVASMRAIALVPLVPAVWMLVQVLPLDFARVSHSVWQSAAEAIGRPIRGTISVDPGATVVALFHYQMALAIVLVAAAVAVERSRAVWVLSALTLATTVVALMVVFHSLGIFTIFPDAGGTGPGDAASGCAVLAAILSATTGIRAYERRVTGRSESDSSWIAIVSSFALSAIAFLTSVLALGLAASVQAAVAAGFGIVTLLGVVVARHLDLGLWGRSAMAVMAVLAAVSIVALSPGVRNANLTLAFAGKRPSSLVSVTERILADGAWTGSGAGTFSALVPIYRSANDLDVGPAAPTAAAAIAVEMGHPMLWAIVIATFGMIAFLLQAATRRGRDYFYSAAGASCLVAVTFMSFGGVGLFNTAVTVIVAIVVGVAVGQSKSRTV